MSLSILAIHDYLESQVGITNLIGVGHIWLDIAGDGSALPYIVISQVDQVPTYQTAGTRIGKLRLRIEVYAATLAIVSAICGAVLAALPINQAVTVNTWGLLLENGPNPVCLGQGAYQATLEYWVWEDLT